MAEGTNRELQAKKKTELQTSAERTKPGVVFTPAVDIFETEKEIVLLADMPGVKPDDLVIDLRENTLTLSGDVVSPAHPGEVEVVEEYRTGQYYRQFMLSEVVDQDKIEAKMKSGVLNLILPKIKKAAPRKITVNIA